jgi:tellurite resistance protein TehA-like permease
MSQAGPAVLSANGLASVAHAFGGGSFVGAILLWGYGIWWLATAALITQRYLREGLPFNIGWWGYTFPLGVFAVATLRLSTMVPMWRSLYSAWFWSRLFLVCGCWSSQRRSRASLTDLSLLRHVSTRNKLKLGFVIDCS